MFTNTPFRTVICKDITHYQGQQALENARAAHSTIRAERKFIRAQIKEQELNLKKLRDNAEAIESRLTSAMYQVGLVRDILHSQGIPINDDYNSDSDDSIDDAFLIVGTEYRRTVPAH
jgi:chromosome segregation ATPase